MDSDLDERARQGEDTGVWIPVENPVDQLERLRVDGWNVYFSATPYGYSASAHPRDVCAIPGDTWLGWVMYGVHGPTFDDTVASLCDSIQRMGQRVITKAATPPQTADEGF